MNPHPMKKGARKHLECLHQLCHRLDALNTFLASPGSTEAAINCGADRLDVERAILVEAYKLDQAIHARRQRA